MLLNKIFTSGKKKKKDIKNMTKYNKYPFINTISATSKRSDERLVILTPDFMQ